MKWITIQAVMIVALLASCCTPRTQKTTDARPEGAVEMTINRVILDGCGYLLTGNDGIKFEPVNLDKSYHADNLKVWVAFVPVKNGMSICMAGQMVEITYISKR